MSTEDILNNYLEFLNSEEYDKELEKEFPGQKLSWKDKMNNGIFDPKYKNSTKKRREENITI